MIVSKNFYALIILLVFYINAKSQNSYFNLLKNDLLKDSTITQIRKSDSKVKSGIFFTPSMGVEYPMNSFRVNSSSSFCLGVKLEYASQSIYPVIFGISYEHQDHNGIDNYKTLNYLNSLETKISSYGGGIDLILNKYLKSNYTIPFLVTELKYIMVQRIIDPAVNSTNLKTSDNFIGVMGGIGFTLYIFDIYGTYTFAKEYTTFAFKMRFHFPVIKF